MESSEAAYRQIHQEGDVARVEIEEEVARFENPNNGGSPLWCYGAPLMVRHGDEVYLVAMETGAGVKPLCNTKWRLMRRDATGWSEVFTGEDYNEREPCPILQLPDGDMVMSVNPIHTPGESKGRCDPMLLRFDGAHKSDPPEVIAPVWDEGTFFTEHSYRGIGVDGASGEILLLNIHSKTGDPWWSYRTAGGEWTTRGKIAFPIRSCYPQVGLGNGAAHVMAIGDIVEPVEEWRAFKYEQTQRDWDYVFRRLFYASTRDIQTEDFSVPIEIDTVEETAGHILNLDLILDDSGDVHLLYLKSSIQYESMRDRFFPGEEIETSLEYVRIVEGQVEERRTRMRKTADSVNLKPTYGRFHRKKDGTLLTVMTALGSNGKAGTYLLGLGEDEAPESLGLAQGLRPFFTATERGGSPPSDTVDLFGFGSEPGSLRYAKITL
jgi:hypothetical protein